jgi:hypothetical protein
MAPVGGEWKLDEFQGLQYANDSTSFLKTARNHPGHSVKLYKTGCGTKHEYVSTHNFFAGHDPDK